MTAFSLSGLLKQAANRRLKLGTVLENHAQQLVSIDCFTVRTIRFRALYVFLVLAHDRRRILHFERMHILAVLKQTKWVLPNGIRIRRGRRTQCRVAPAAAPCS